MDSILTAMFLQVRSFAKNMLEVADVLDKALEVIITAPPSDSTIEFCSPLQRKRNVAFAAKHRNR